MADAAIAGGGVGSVAGWRERLFGALADRLAAEGERRLLWLPVFFGSGIGFYFVLKAEPPLWPGIAAAIAGIGAALALRRHPACSEAALALTALAAGFALMRETAWERGAPMLQRHLGPVVVTGRVVDIDLAEKGWRIVIAPDPLPGLDAGDLPRRLRLHIPQKSDELNPGDRVSLKAMLYPVPAQILPGGRDYQRELYFAGIGGVGYTFGAAHRIAGTEPEGGWREDLRHLRTEMTRRIASVLPGSTGGVASALITGKRGAISEEVKQAFRDSGLSHLLAIAGLHLGLVGAFVFFTVRGGLALVPRVALQYPIKKIAAGATLFVLACYLLISGAAIPTERAFVMNGLVFFAIIIDRLRISMRICAIAAAIVLGMDPSVLVGVSFQMSFGAVVALIAVYEAYGARLGRLLHGRSLLGQVLGYCGGVVVTTAVVTLGTYPFAIYHFHHIALYSPLANVIAVPLSAMWTLPWGVVACLSMPLGLERLALLPMGWGIDLTIWVAARLCPAGQCLGNAAIAGGRLAADLVRRAVAVLVARSLAPLGCGRDSRGAHDDDADEAARLADCRWRALSCGAGARPALFRRRGEGRKGWSARSSPRKWAADWTPGPPQAARPKAGSIAPAKLADTRHAAARLRSSPAPPGYRSNAAALMRLSAKCRPASAAGR
jgi:competence protein ComEC